YGFHIIRLEERKSIPSYEDMEPILKSKILRDSRSSLIQSQVLAMQMAKYDFRENEPVVAAIRPIINRQFTEGKESQADPIQGTGLMDSVLFIIQEDTFLTRSFVEFIGAGDRIPTASPG